MIFKVFYLFWFNLLFVFVCLSHCLYVYLARAYRCEGTYLQANFKQHERGTKY